MITFKDPVHEKIDLEYFIDLANSFYEGRRNVAGKWDRALRSGENYVIPPHEGEPRRIEAITIQSSHFQIKLWDGKHWRNIMFNEVSFSRLIKGDENLKKVIIDNF